MGWEVKQGNTACVCTIEQTIQALRFLCWFGGTKFVDIVLVVFVLKLPKRMKELFGR
jgi:hypothetical protein